jgi:hypothetical protein
MSQSHIENERTRLEFERRNAVNELAGIGPARAADEITPDLSRRLAIPGVDACLAINGPVSRMHCPVIADLQSELARTNKRGALSGLIAQHDRDLAKLGAPAIPNADSAALVAVFATFGISIDQHTVNVALMLLSVAILECASGMALCVAQSMRSAAPVMREVPASVITVPTVKPAPAIDTSALAGKTAARIAELARNAGGSVSFDSKRKLATALGTSTGTACRALTILAAGGAVIGNEAGNVVVSVAA